MPTKSILLLGNEDLYQTSVELQEHEIATAKRVIQDLHDTMMEFRAKYGFGRAITAPQIGEFYRIIYMNIDGKATAMINPQLEFINDERIKMWDDCMSFPGLEVSLYRFKNCIVRYKDQDWNDCVLHLQDDLAELIQHEYDHLDGILAIQRAIDNKSLRINKAKAGCY
jgi:peptide deformylase